jgi:hypothetical protein
VANPLKFQESGFIDSIVNILCVDPFFMNLKCAIEQLDIFGIARVYKSYQVILEKEEKIDFEKISYYYKFSEKKIPFSSENSSSGDIDFHYSVMATYLMAKTLRDCSFIFTIRLGSEESNMNKSQRIFDSAPVNRADSLPLFEYKIQVIDLDPKNPLKIPSYYKLHQDLKEHCKSLSKTNRKYRKCFINNK